MKNEHNKMCSLVTNEKINNAWLTMAGADGGLCLYNLTHMTFAPKPTKKPPIKIGGDWQGRRDSNTQHVVLETTALPIELLP